MTSSTNAEFLFKMYDVKGFDLPAKDKTTSDPYFEVYFGQVKKYKSNFIKKTLNPVWTSVVTETFTTQRADYLNKQYLKICKKQIPTNKQTSKHHINK